MATTYGCLTARSTFASVVLLAALGLSGGCSRIPLMPGGARDLLNTDFERHYFTLRQSVFFGPFYGDPNLRLMDPRPFHGLAYLTLPTGKPLTPGASQGIFPAGTRVWVETVEMPTLGSIVGRPNFSPRYNGWVRLRVNRFDVTTPGFEDVTYILVLPLGITDPEAMGRWLKDILGPDDEVKAWLERRAPETRTAIAQKQARLGMSLEELVAALGNPDEVQKDVATEGKQETARFGDLTVVLVEDVVKEIRGAGTAPPPASPAPTTPAPTTPAEPAPSATPPTTAEPPPPATP